MQRTLGNDELRTEDVAAIITKATADVHSFCEN